MSEQRAVRIEWASFETMLDTLRVYELSQWMPCLVATYCSRRGYYPCFFSLS